MRWPGAEKKTPAVGEPDQRQPTDWIQAYEDLRGRWLLCASASTGGLAVLQERGMAAWMELCSVVLPEPIPVLETSSGASESPLRLGELTTDLVRLMTQMILSTTLEAAHD